MVRDAIPADVPEVARVQVDSWRVAYDGLMPVALIESFTVERRIDQWNRFFAASPHRGALVVAEHDGVVGMASFGPARGEPEGTGEIAAIYVTADHWGHGHGRDLILEAERRFREAGHTAAVLWVLTANDRARRFYEAAGWTTDGHTRIEALPDGDLQEVRYRRDLGVG
jgi:ribosomal protein S18 acetylase RimI-like enzyme